jgi:hypothetical protein
VDQITLSQHKAFGDKASGDAARRMIQFTARAT